MYRFQISAVTEPGETIALVGSSPDLGAWDETQVLRLCTSGDRYPLWWVDVNWSEASFCSADNPRVAYKYVKIRRDGSLEWEAWGVNRWVPLERDARSALIVVEDGDFGGIRSEPYGYFAEPIESSPNRPSENGLKIVVIGSSVAMGCSAWLLRGWAWHLGQALQQRYGHQLVNVSELGATVGSTIARFAQVVAPQQPDIVIIALSLGNEGLAVSTPQQQRAIQRRFENGLQQLIKMTQDIGARPMLGAVYPNGGYSAEQYQILQETHHRLRAGGIPVLDWLAVLEDGRGRWNAGLSFDPAHPNTTGHHRMFEAIDLSLFQHPPVDQTTAPPNQPPPERLLYQHSGQFFIFADRSASSLRILNTSPYAYTLDPNWQDCQRALQLAQGAAGLYLAEDSSGTVASLFIQDDGRMATTLPLTPGTDLTFYPAFRFFDAQRSQVLFYDGHLGLLKVSDHHLYLINESDHEYNLHPMWPEVRAALKAMPEGVYEDPTHPDAPFRTLMIDADGLTSRVKVPAQSGLGLTYQCPLSNISRVAIIPLGDRCAARMLLYKLEYDGPAFPFDLTRTTDLADVADIIQTGFEEMWNPELLHYSSEARRIYHAKWAGLSFAHEVEEEDDPIHDMSPVYERMRTRYTARAKRFWHTLQTCDKALFVRTGGSDRGRVLDLVSKLQQRCQGKPFRLLLISPQSSQEFAEIPNVLHYNLEFNPDRMYADAEHWQDCTAVMRTLLNHLGISSKNLFWCPPNIP